MFIPIKNRKWRICVYFRSLNEATRKDHFLLPFIAQVLDQLAKKRCFSFLDGFFGYNQIKIAEEYQNKMNCTYPWGMFTYQVLSFGLCNAPTTFQRAMIIIFSDFINDLIEYLWMISPWWIIHLVRIYKTLRRP